MPMPSVTDLQTMYGDWNPQAYLQAQGNADLERQYRESEYGRQQQLTKQAGLESAFQEQNNPLRLEQSRLTNQNLGYTGQGQQATNRKLGVEADIAEQTKQYKLNDAQRKELLAASDQDIAMGESEAKRLMMSLNPEERKRGEQLYGFTKYARDEKLKHEQTMEKERYSQQQQTGRLLEQINANRGIEEMRQAGQASRAVGKQTPTDFWTTFNSKLKTARDKHAALIGEATRLGPDSPDAQVMLRMAEAIRPQAEAEIATVKPGGINVGEVAGMPVNPSPQIAPKGNSPSAEFNIPAGAVQKLKSNPSLREAFDAKYGQGASAKILGK